MTLTTAGHELSATVHRALGDIAQTTDRLLIPMALGGGCCFTTSRITIHADANISVIMKSLKIEIDAQEIENKLWWVSVERYLRYSIDQASHDRFWLHPDLPGMSKIGPAYPRLWTFRQRCPHCTRFLPLHPRSQTWQAPPTTLHNIGR